MTTSASGDPNGLFLQGNASTRRGLTDARPVASTLQPSRKRNADCLRDLEDLPLTSRACISTEHDTQSPLKLDPGEQPSTLRLYIKEERFTPEPVLAPQEDASSPDRGPQEFKAEERVTNQEPVSEKEHGSPENTDNSDSESSFTDAEGDEDTSSESPESSVSMVNGPGESQNEAAGAAEQERNSGTKNDMGQPRIARYKVTKVREMTLMGKVRQRTAPKAVAAPRSIPHSWEMADEADKFLVTMKEKGCSWVEIRKVWQEETGQLTGKSTLPNRYNRIKDNMTYLKKGDAKRLLAAEVEVEMNHQREKWRLVAEAMQRAGGATYKRAFIERSFKELCKDPARAVTPTDDDSESERPTEISRHKISRDTENVRLEPPEVPRNGASDSNPDLSSLSESVLTDPRSRDSQQQHLSQPQNPQQQHVVVQDRIVRQQPAADTIALADTDPSAATMYSINSPAVAKDPSKEGRRPCRSVSHRELRYLVKRKVVNAANRNKSWIVIARECGITASLRDISKALERAGFPSIFSS